MYPKGVDSQYMTIPIYAVAVAMILIIPISSDLRKERGFHLAGAMGIAAVSFIAIVAAGPARQKVQYAFLCFGVGGIYASAPIALVWTSNIISWPAEKRAVTQAFVNAMGNSASIYGSFLWPANTAPKYTMGFSVTL